MIGLHIRFFYIDKRRGEDPHYQYWGKDDLQKVWEADIMNLLLSYSNTKQTGQLVTTLFDVLSSVHAKTQYDKR